MKHGRSCDIIQMMYGNEYDIQIRIIYDGPEVENIALGLHPRAIFSTTGPYI